jgi:hypothetical protein
MVTHLPDATPELARHRESVARRQRRSVDRDDDELLEVTIVSKDAQDPVHRVLVFRKRDVLLRIAARNRSLRGAARVGLVVWAAVPSVGTVGASSREPGLRVHGIDIRSRGDV